MWIWSPRSTSDVWWKFQWPASACLRLAKLGCLDIVFHHLWPVGSCIYTTQIITVRTVNILQMAPVTSSDPTRWCLPRFGFALGVLHIDHHIRQRLLEKDLERLIRNQLMESSSRPILLVGFFEDRVGTICGSNIIGISEIGDINGLIMAGYTHTHIYIDREREMYCSFCPNILLINGGSPRIKQKLHVSCIIYLYYCLMILCHCFCTMMPPKMTISKCENSKNDDKPLEFGSPPPSSRP
jgi:hypothetical protein